MISAVISRIVIIVFGTLYPAYASFKAVKTKNVKEYVKWMMYWIVFALFTTGETFADILLAFWFPFYYEMKIILVVWLLSPTTKGSSILYRKFVHPQLTKREKEIDEYIARTTEQGYHTVLQVGMGGINFAREFLMQTALRGGGTLVEQLRRSYSLSDLSTQETTDGWGPKRRTQTINEELLQSEANIGDHIDDVIDSVINNNEDSEDDITDGPTQSSGYSSATTVSAKNKKNEAAAAGKRRTRTCVSSKATSGANTSPNNNSEDVTYATLPRVRKTRRKTAQNP